MMQVLHFHLYRKYLASLSTFMNPVPPLFILIKIKLKSRRMISLPREKMIQSKKKSLMVSSRILG